MGNPAEEVVEEEAYFDVMVRLPKGAGLADIERGAHEAGVRPDRVAALIKALQAVPDVKIGASVDAERAAKARDQFTRAGLVVEVTPVLGLTALTTGRFDGLEECKACHHRVKMSEDRQCPHCHVYVDKVTDEILLRQQLRKKEQAAADFRANRDQRQADQSVRAEMEARIREEIQREMAAKAPGNAGGSASGSVRARLALVLVGAVAVAVAFVAGRGLASGWNFDNLTTVGKLPPTAQAKATELLDKIEKIDKGASAGGSTAAAAAANGGPATGDPDVDDPLVQAAGGKRVGAKGISIEQAVAAAQTLSKAAGYKGAGTDDAVVAAGAPAPASPPAPGGDAAQPGTSAAGAGGSAAAGGAGGAAPAPNPAASAMSARARALLALELTRLVAQVGQGPRARGIFKSVSASPAIASDAEFAANAKVTDIELRAWALHDTAPGALRPAVDALLAQAMALPDPYTRARALMEAGVIAARHPGLPPETARLFLTKSSDALPEIQGALLAGAMSDWAVSLGEVVLAEATARARAGHWSRARALGQQVETLIAQAPDAASQARLYAIDYQVKSLLGQGDKLQASLDAALGLAAKQPGLIDRAGLLRNVARLSGAAMHDKMAAAIESVKTAGVAASGFERMRTLTLLALLHADAGMRARAGEFTQLALATPRLSEVETTELTADVLLRGDMATARALHRDGLYVEAEALLQRLGSFLF
ncbi:hypothetical protein [Caenimonas koreensis]|uniref:hypothetical protein n=1 Tax=Caenimonas koreensis TaxID=367474 RepID=UPI0037840B7B